ncbi:MAG: type III pantothenate kinase [Culicoidibacterales bacterium]
MLLAFDIGNTNTVVGVFEGDQMIANWRLSTDRKRTSDEYGAKIHSLFLFKQLDFASISDVIISCVVPDALQNILWFVEKYLNCQPMIVGQGLKTGINMKIDNPKSSGADLVVTATGAYHKYHETLVIVDMGTATTVTVVTQNGEYLGGAIAPGINVAMNALSGNAAQLPRIELNAPPKAIGTNTIHAMQSGLVYGYAGLIDRIVSEILAEVPNPKRVVATGGQARLIAEHARTIDFIDENLLLDGLLAIYQMNRRS